VIRRSKKFVIKFLNAEVSAVLYSGLMNCNVYAVSAKNFIKLIKKCLKILDRKI